MVYFAGGYLSVLQVLQVKLSAPVLQGLENFSGVFCRYPLGLEACRVLHASSEGFACCGFAGIKGEFCRLRIVLHVLQGLDLSKASVKSGNSPCVS
jgi:hypothetical protein